MSNNALIWLLTATTIGGFAGAGYFFVQSQANSAALESTRAALQKEQQAVQLARAKLRSPPVAVQLRQAVLGDGLVAMVHATTDRDIPFRLTVRRPATGATRTFDLVLPALGQMGSVKEIGHAEGWAFMKGDELTFHNESFVDATFTVP
jgi:hypothetical protein